MGLLILAAVFTIPVDIENPQLSPTFYGLVSLFLSNIQSIQSSGDPAIVGGYLVVLAFVLLVVAGLFGFFPRVTGVLGVIAMFMLTAGAIILDPRQISLSDFGPAEILLWFAAMVALGASYWLKRAKTASPISQAQIPPVVVQPTIHINTERDAVDVARANSPTYDGAASRQRGRRVSKQKGASAIEEEVSRLFCPQCGVENDTDAVYCTACGVKID